MKSFKDLIPNPLKPAKGLPVLWTGLFFLSYLSVFFLSGTSPPGYTHLEHAWNAVLEHAARFGMQFGKEIVFTYGPLGYLNGHIGQGYFINERILFAFAWSGLVAWALTGIGKRMPGRPSRYLFLAWVLALSSLCNLEQQAYLAMAYGCLLLIGHEGEFKPAQFIYLLAFLLASLIKFTFFFAAVVSLTICYAVQIGKGKYKAAALFGVLFAAGFLALWWASGQQPVNIWPWIRSSFEIAGGYSEAMSVPPAQNVLIACLIAMGLFLMAVVLRAAALQFTVANAGFLLVTVLYAFLSWKQGFVRADGHVFAFILFLPVAFALLLAGPVEHHTSKAHKWSLDALYLAVIVACTLAANYQEPHKITNAIGGYPGRLMANASLVLQSLTGETTRRYKALRTPTQEEGELVASLAVPRSMVGNAPTDVISFHQMIALANRLNYRPRPVFQSYATYTPYLQELNLAFFQSGRRPEYVFYKMESIDNRFPTQDEGSTLLYILQNYDLVWHDDYVLLLKLRKHAQDLRLTKLSERTAAFGERLDLSPWRGMAVFMRVEVKPTLIGRLIKLFFQPSPLVLQTDNGKELTNYRFIPSMAKQGFLISPLLEVNADLVKVFQHRGTQVDSLSFIKPDSFFGQYADSLTVQFFKFE